MFGVQFEYIANRIGSSIIVIDMVNMFLKEYSIGEIAGLYGVIKRITQFIIFTIFKTVEISYISLEDINEWNAMFPFEYKITREMIALDDKYHITAFECEPVIVLSK